MPIFLEEYFQKNLSGRSIREILLDKELAQLGDAYVNFIYSLALSISERRPLGKKVSSDILANAIKESDIRRLLPSGSDRHAQGDAAEALILSSWITGRVTIEEAVRVLGKETDPVRAFKGLLLQVMKGFEKGLKDRVSEPLREL
jgi:hypothetical protein